MQPQIVASVQKLQAAVGFPRVRCESCGLRIALLVAMGFGRLEDIVAHQFAEEFKHEVYELIKASPDARRDFKFIDQLRGAASGIAAAIAEGFGRDKASEFVTFLRYALASLAEAKTHLQDGIHRGHFAEAESRLAFTWARRCRPVLRNLLASQLKLAAADRAAKGRRRRRGNSPGTS
jgi:four helix bundle protein